MMLYRVYVRVDRLKGWFNRRFTPLGKHLLLLVCLALFFGVNVQRTMIYQLFSAGLAVLAGACLFSLRFRPQATVQLALPPTCVAGQRLTFRLRVENRGRRPLQGLLFREAARRRLPSRTEFAAAREEGEERRNLFDRKMGYYRWLWLLEVGQRVIAPEKALPDIPPGESREVEGSLQPLRRGPVHFDGVVLARLDPFGLCRREHLCAGEANLLVLPRIYPVPTLFFQGARRYHQGGLSAARNLGDSSEFLSLREYVQGDPIKNIDWKATARTGRTIVKQYRSEYFSRYALVLDNFSSRSHCPVFEEAVALAASIILAQDSFNSVLDLLFVEDECIAATAGGGLGGRQRMLEILASVSTCRERDFTELAGLVRSHGALLSGVVLLLLDFDGVRRGLLQYLLAEGIAVRALVLTDDRGRFEERRAREIEGLPLRVLEAARVEDEVGRL